MSEILRCAIPTFQLSVNTLSLLAARHLFAQARCCYLLCGRVALRGSLLAALPTLTARPFTNPFNTPGACEEASGVGREFLGDVAVAVAVAQALRGFRRRGTPEEAIARPTQRVLAAEGGVRVWPSCVSVRCVFTRLSPCSLAVRTFRWRGGLVPGGVAPSDGVRPFRCRGHA